MATREREKALKIRENREKRPHAKAKYVRISSSKVKIVIDLIRGKIDRLEMVVDDEFWPLIKYRELLATLS